jgi:hypothetical protein
MLTKRPTFCGSNVCFINQTLQITYWKQHPYTFTQEYFNAWHEGLSWIADCIRLQGTTFFHALWPPYCIQDTSSPTPHIDVVSREAVTPVVTTHRKLSQSVCLSVTWRLVTTDFSKGCWTRGSLSVSGWSLLWPLLRQEEAFREQASLAVGREVDTVACSSPRLHTPVGTVACSSPRLHAPVGNVACSSPRMHTPVGTVACSSPRLHTRLGTVACSSSRLHTPVGTVACSSSTSSRASRHRSVQLTTSAHTSRHSSVQLTTSAHTSRHSSVQLTTSAHTSRHSSVQLTTSARRSRETGLSKLILNTRSDLVIKHDVLFLFHASCKGPRSAHTKLTEENGKEKT